MPPLPSGVMALQASSVLHMLQLIPPHPSLHSQYLPSRGVLSRPSAREPHNGSAQSSPPKPGGHAHLPLYLLHLANCKHLKASSWQLKHGGQFGGRSSSNVKGWETTLEVE
jgi:hypothetical protein